MTTANRSRVPASGGPTPALGATLLGWGAGLVWLVGCSSAQLVPLQATHGKETLVVGSGIEVRANAEEHPASVPSSFTPVRLSVRNTGAQPVYVGLDDIDLAGPEQALDAVPPGNIPARQRIASLGTDPGSPFIVQQTTGGSGPRVGRSESVLLEPRLGSLPGWSLSRDRARQEISNGAFPSGSIGAGETRQGFVYFRTVAKDGEHLTLRVGVRPSPDGAPVSVVEIAYAVRS